MNWVLFVMMSVTVWLLIHFLVFLVLLNSSSTSLWMWVLSFFFFVRAEGKIEAKLFLPH